VVGRGFARDEDFAMQEDWLVAMVVAGLVVELHVPEECGGVLEQMVVECVLRGGFGEVGPIVKRRGVAFLEGELVEEGAVADPDGAVVGAEDDVFWLWRGGVFIVVVLVVVVFAIVGRLGDIGV